MATTSLVATVIELGVRLGTILEAMPAENPFEPPGDSTDPPSFLFEAHVLLGLLEGLREKKWQIAEADPKVNPMRFLRGPGNKSGTTFFRATKGATAVQVVHGSGLKDRFDAAQHPDISLQPGAAGLDPKAEDLLAMWDMKLKGDFGFSSDSRIDKDDIAKFNLMATDLGLRSPGDVDVMLDDFPEAFSVSAIIGNGQHPTAPDASLLEKGFSCVAQYQGPNSPPRPTRAEQVSQDPRKMVAVGT